MHINRFQSCRSVFFLAHHFAHGQDYEKAEKCFMKAQCPGECVEMYNRAAKWDRAFRKHVSLNRFLHIVQCQLQFLLNNI
jgi:hypothetical protein